MPQDPTPTPASARFWDRIADRYARKPVADQAAYEEKLKVTPTHLRPGMRVLEFGCGTGSTALVHAPLVRSVLAIDISARMIEIARAKAEAAGAGNVTFRRATLADLDAHANTSTRCSASASCICWTTATTPSHGWPRC